MWELTLHILIVCLILLVSIKYIVLGKWKDREKYLNGELMIPREECNTLCDEGFAVPDKLV